MKDSKLWKSVFDNGNNTKYREISNKAETCIENYKVILNKLRERIQFITSSISNDLEGITLHDISHIDAIWDIADLLVSEKQEFNPTEVFVFGVSALIHDAGLSILTYPNKVNDLKETIEYKNLLKIECHKAKADNPNNLPAEVLDKVKWICLRKLHAKKAKDLPSIKWSFNTEEAYLIDDPEIRKHFREMIGEIASSHAWSVYETYNKLNGPIGAYPPSPTEWTVDRFKIASLLRLCDAINVDSRRAPYFQYIINSPSEESNQHWIFQGKLMKPTIEDNAISFVSTSAFEIHETNAWWLCYDWMQMIDMELKSIHEINIESGRYQFACNRVSRINSPINFSNNVKVSNWTPVDSSYKISDIKGLIEKFGGRNLYGGPIFAIRELVQNAIDAVNARKIIQNNYSGEIIIQIENGENKKWLTIQDNGIGMSKWVLTNILLDFGKSLWNSYDVIDVHPQLLINGFESSGKFGIGFFSTFMLGDHVKVISRSYDKGFDDINLLEFVNGYKLRPILKRGDQNELPIEGGTKIFVDISDCEYRIDYCVLKRNITTLFPASSVTILLKDEDEVMLRIDKSDWLNISAESLYERTETEVDAKEYLLSLIKDENTIYGRASLCHHGASSQNGVMVDKCGIKICKAEFFPGIVIGEPINLERTNGDLLIPTNALREWATEQAKIHTKDCFKSICEELFFSSMVLCCGGSLSDRAFVSYRNIGVNMEKFKSYIQNMNEFYVFYKSYFEKIEKDEMEIYKKDTGFYNWIINNHVFRITPHFCGNGMYVSGNIDRVLEISGIARNSIWENPVIDLVRTLMKEVWGDNIMETTLEQEILSYEYQRKELKKESVLQFKKSELNNKL